jgi:hypothetical protein
MKLIGAGLPRTGTLSQKVALETLGLAPCYHMVNVLGDLDRAQVWCRALEGEEPWEEAFEGFQASVDWPGSFFYKQLIEAYPDAKVILSVRTADSWERSMHKTIWGLFYGDTLMRDMSSARGRVDSQWYGYIDMMKKMWLRSGLIKSATEPKLMTSAMESFNDEVRQTVPPERLLVWSASDGWDPICEFLDVPVPATPFPHLNDGDEFADRIVDGALGALQKSRPQKPPAVATA